MRGVRTFKVLVWGEAPVGFGKVHHPSFRPLGIMSWSQCGSLYSLTVYTLSRYTLSQVTIAL